MEHEFQAAMNILAGPPPTAPSRYNQSSIPIVLISGKQLQVQIRISHAGMYEKLDPSSPRYDPTFPKPIRISGRSIRFIQSEVNDWILARIQASRNIDKSEGNAK